MAYFFLERQTDYLYGFLILSFFYIAVRFFATSSFPSFVRFSNSFDSILTLSSRFLAEN